MERKKNIARILLVVAVLFTTVFQLVHSYQHISSAVAYELEHESHTACKEKTSLNNGVQLTENHNHQEHCFACDFIPTSGLEAAQLDVQFTTYQTIQKVQEGVQFKFVPLAHVYYSLRAPPVMV